ncbi:MAG TPA: hypothetical protein DCM10_17445 [Xanthomarina gelatinilytica]|nr:hypothetical protein [Xanthomarina gelatinilytica]|tara:strand:- start:351 stop:632 length:282 start_codon:yes stop_codon:yes gene_type:complete
MKISFSKSDWIRTERKLSITDKGEFVAQGTVNLARKEISIDSINCNLLESRTYEDIAEQITSMVVDLLAKTESWYYRADLEIGSIDVNINEKF